jgi:broad specificity phosphatase PhoE
MSGTELILIRHGESLWNVERRWQGQADPPLTERGRAQARDAAARIAALAPQALYASDLARAFETAAILGGALGLEPTPEPRLREFHVGAWSGLTKPEIDARWPGEYARFRRREPDVRPGGGESPRELLKRVLAALADIAAGHPGERVAVVSHGGVALSLTSLRLENLGYVRLGHAGGEAWHALDEGSGSGPLFEL